MNPSAFDLANDHTFRTMLAPGTPPIPARISAVNANPGAAGTYTLDSLIGDGELTAIALNGWTYDVADVVYVLLAAGSTDNGIILGTVHTADQHLHIGNPSAPDLIFSARGDYGRFFLFDGQITTTETTLIPAGEIGSYTRTRILVDDGANSANGTPTLTVPASSYNSANITVGAETVQIRLYADGSLRAIVSSGTGTYSLMGWALSTD